MINVNHGFYAIAQASGDFPPAFASSQLVYGGVLFMLISMSAIAMQVLLEEMAVYYRSSVPHHSPRGLYSRLQILLMSAFIAAVAPDGLFMLAWGELTSSSIAILALVDRVFDFVSGLFFFRWWWLRAQTSEIVELQLSPFTSAQNEWLTAEQLRNKLILLSMSLVLALGVAVAK